MSHTSEKRWRTNQNDTNGAGVSDQASGLVVEMLNALTRASAGFAEMQEIYDFTGSSVQGLADQLFLEDWASRSAPGVNAVLTVGVVAGLVISVAIGNAGTGYVDGNSYAVNLTATAGGGDGAAVISYDVVGGLVTNVAVDAAGSTYSNGLGQTVLEMVDAGVVFETQANAAEVAKTQDLFNAMTALNDLHQVANNVAVSQEDRYAQLRRMS